MSKPGGPKTRAHLDVRLVPIPQMTTSQIIQRERKEYRIAHLAQAFDPDKFGVPLVNFRNGRYYIINGQHRIEAYKRWSATWEKEAVYCEVLVGLDERQEAEQFLKRNDQLQVNIHDRFRNGVTANYPAEVEISRIVADLGLCVSRDDLEGAVKCVGTLLRVFKRSDGAVLKRTLRIIRDAFGDPGLQAKLIDGMGHLCHRYNGTLDEKAFIGVLSETRGGVNGVLGKAQLLHKQTGESVQLCVAAALVEVFNARKDRAAKRLPNWWKESKALSKDEDDPAPRAAADNGAGLSA